MARAVTNKFVSVNRRSLTVEEQHDINRLFVKTGKIGGFIRSRGKSGVWNYFGELCFKESETVTILVDDQHHHCSLCLIKCQQMPAGHAHISKIQSYTLSTATTTLSDHLRNAHDIKLAKVCLCQIVNQSSLINIQY